MRFATTIAAAAALSLAAASAIAGDSHNHGHSHDHSHDHSDDHGDGEKRQLDAHVHGEGVLNIAVEGGELQMELASPGADIVGFETKPETDEQKAAVEAAKKTLSDPIAVFGPSAAANCEIEKADVELHVEEETGHSEFHAEYHLDCANMDELKGMQVTYFDLFEGAEALEVTVLGGDSQTAFEVTRDAPSLDLSGLDLNGS
ncbi:MAG: DUF2796 domain-containing protein [Pseudomonadota bacterium]